MATVIPPAGAPDRPLPPPNVTPEWVAELEFWSAERGLPPEPWPIPAPNRR